MQYIGIDISKKCLDVALDGSKRTWRVTNDEEGLKALMARFFCNGEERCIVCEPTGGYERPLLEMSAQHQVPVHCAHPNKVRYFARACGQLAKTDRIDAQMLARYGQTLSVSHNIVVPKKELMVLETLLRRREQLMEQFQAEKNRLEIPQGIYFMQSVCKHIEWLTEALKALNKAIISHISHHAEIEEKSRLLQSMPGIGLQTASTLIVYLPELGNIPAPKLAALVGVVPYAKESGGSFGKRSIFGGRKVVRKALYMAALAAIRFNAVMHAFYHKLRHKGKPAKLAIIAVVHKMITILNIMVERSEYWSEKATGSRTTLQ